MAGARGPKWLWGAARLGIVGGATTAVLVQLTSALAQLPAPPALPSAVPSAVPSALPSALPFAGAKPPPLPPPAPAGEEKPAKPPPMPPPRPSEVVLFDAQATELDEPAGKLPKELRAEAAPERVREPKDKAGLDADTPIVSASMQKEGIRAALGSVIVLTRRDLWTRGYADLSQLLDDLPGTDVVRPWGDVYVRSYFRGNRTAGADAFLLMVDGVAYNQLFTGSAQILAALPISDVERVEIVFGPLSTVYGSGAAMGVINVITSDGRERQGAGYHGATIDVRASFGGPQRSFSRFGNTSKTVDATASYVAKDYRVRLSARLESSVFDTGAGDGFELTRSSYYASKSVWGTGTFEAYPDLAGALRSPDRKGAVDARVFLGKGTEIAGQLFTLSTGYGVEYPGDRRQAAGLYTSREWSAYARHTAEVTSGVVSTTLLQLRESDISAQSLTSDLGSTVTLANTDSSSSAAVVRQDLDMRTRRGLLLKDDQLGVGTGLRYRHLTLPGAAAGSSSAWAPSDAPTQVATTGVTVPGKPFDEIGAYLLARYSFNRRHHTYLGASVDKTWAQDDINVSARVGYAGTVLDMLTFKLWYGHSILEPSRADELAAAVPPVLPPALLVSRFHMVEGDIDLTLPYLALHADGYFAYETNPVVAFRPTSSAGALVNVSSRKLPGFDVGARLLTKPVYAWVYYAHAFHLDDGVSSLPDGTPATLGDIAANKLWAGITVSVGPFTGTLLNRTMLTYDVVPTNPADAPSGYSLLDANLMLEHRGSWVALRATNIIGTAYSHPGIQTADSGTAGPRSKGPYSSLLPQPGRGFFATVGFRFEQR